MSREEFSTIDACNIQFYKDLNKQKNGKSSKEQGQLLQFLVYYRLEHCLVIMHIVMVWLVSM